MTPTLPALTQMSDDHEEALKAALEAFAASQLKRIPKVTIKEAFDASFEIACRTYFDRRHRAAAQVGTDMREKAEAWLRERGLNAEDTKSIHWAGDVQSLAAEFTAIRLAALEEGARVADKKAENHRQAAKDTPNIEARDHFESSSLMAEEIAAAIRALAK